MHQPPRYIQFHTLYCAPTKSTPPPSFILGVMPTQIHHIQRLNNLWDSESIQSRAELKVPTSAAYSRSFTPSPKPRNKKLNHRMASSMQDIRHMDNERREGEEGEEDVKRKPSGRLREKRLSTEPFQEKSIASLLTAADERIAEMQRFNEKLAQKM